MEITDFKNPNLKSMASPVSQFGDELKTICCNMIQLLGQKKLKAVSGPVVGYSYQIIVLSTHILKEKSKDLEVIINPRITKFSTQLLMKPEHCVLFPFIKEIIVRHESIDLSYQDINGKRKKITLNGFMSRLIQHECDHLNGMLIIDRIPEVVLQKYTDKLIL